MIFRDISVHWIYLLFHTQEVTHMEPSGWWKGNAPSRKVLSPGFCASSVCCGHTRFLHSVLLRGYRCYPLPTKRPLGLFTQQCRGRLDCESIAGSIHNSPEMELHTIMRMLDNQVSLCGWWNWDIHGDIFQLFMENCNNLGGKNYFY